MSLSIHTCFLPSNNFLTVFSGSALKRGARGSVCSRAGGARERRSLELLELDRESESESELEDEDEEEEEEEDDEEEE